MSKLKVGIIGTGGISNFHIQAYMENPNVELYAFCDINKEQLDKMGDQYGVERRYTNCEEMLKLPELDAVSVCTWNSAHAPCTIAALNAGKHVICEKPMATTAEEAKQMKEAADRNGRLLMIGFVRRYGNDCAVLRDFIDNGELGDLYYAKATYLRRNGNPGGWFGDKSRSGGGPLIDLGVHVIDLTRYVMGNPKPVSVYGATFKKLGNRSNIKDCKEYNSVSAGNNDICDVEDMVTALIRYDNGAVLQVEASFTLNIKQDVAQIELCGTKGGAKIDPHLQIYTEMHDYLTDISFKAPTALEFDGLFGKEINHFVDCIINNVPCKSPASDGIDIMRILDAVYESAAIGHEVILA